MSVIISIRFLTGRATLHPWQTHHSEGRVDWPPSPWRLLRAIVAVAGRGLTSLPLPDYIAAPGRSRSRAGTTPSPSGPPATTARSPTTGANPNRTMSRFPVLRTSLRRSARRSDLAPQDQRRAHSAVFPDPRSRHGQEHRFCRLRHVRGHPQGPAASVSLAGPYAGRPANGRPQADPRADDLLWAGGVLVPGEGPMSPPSNSPGSRRRASTRPTGRACASKTSAGLPAKNTAATRSNGGSPRCRSPKKAPRLYLHRRFSYCREPNPSMPAGGKLRRSSRPSCSAEQSQMLLLAAYCASRGRTSKMAWNGRSALDGSTTLCPVPSMNCPGRHHSPGRVTKKRSIWSATR